MRQLSHCISLNNPSRVHEAPRIMAAIQQGVTDRVWTIGDPVDAALSPSPVRQCGPRNGRFTAIDGGP